jgi:hypothetical protein
MPEGSNVWKCCVWRSRVVTGEKPFLGNQERKNSCPYPTILDIPFPSEQIIVTALTQWALRPSGKFQSFVRFHLISFNCRIDLWHWPQNRVALRVRPLSGAEQSQDQTQCVFCDSADNTITVELNSSYRSFTFDQVLDDSYNQQLVYDTCVTPLVDKFIEG